MAMSVDQRLRSARRLRLAHVYTEYFAEDPRRERLFLASLGFFAGFGAARTITHAILHQVGPFRNLSIGGRHRFSPFSRLTNLASPIGNRANGAATSYPCGASTIRHGMSAFSSR
jgi:hypothetical protein